MPFYEYQAVDPSRSCAHCSVPFEARQSMSDPALEVCPQCGGKIHRLISVCRVGTHPGAKGQLSDKNLKRLGFSKLVNEGGGKFRKTV